MHGAQHQNQCLGLFPYIMLYSAEKFCLSMKELYQN